MSAAVPTTTTRRLSRAGLVLLLGSMLWSTLLGAEAEAVKTAPSTSAGNLDLGLNRLREKRSGLAGDPNAPEPGVAPKDAARPGPTAAPLVTPVAATPRPSPAPSASGAVKAAPSAAAPVVEPVIARGIRSRELMIGAAVLILLAGIWIHWSQEGYRMDAEEQIKDRKITSDTAARRIANRRLAGNSAIFAGVFLFLFALL